MQHNIYINFFVFFLLISIIGGVLFLVSYLIGHKLPDKEKNQAYECGFSPFEDARQKFDIRFYLVAILFIIFDLEVIFLFPWTLVLFSVNFFGITTMLIFLLVLVVGFIYEWVNGALDWE